MEPPPGPARGRGRPRRRAAPTRRRPVAPRGGWLRRRAGTVATRLPPTGRPVGAQAWAMSVGWAVSDGTAPEDAPLAALARRPVRPGKEAPGRPGPARPRHGWTWSPSTSSPGGRRLAPHAVTAAPLLAPSRPSGCPPPGSGGTVSAGCCRCPARTRRSTALGAAGRRGRSAVRRLVADPVVRSCCWAATTVTSSGPPPGSSPRSGPTATGRADRPPRPAARGRRRRALRRVLRLTADAGRRVFHVELAPAGRSSSRGGRVGTPPGTDGGRRGTRGAHAVTEGVDDGIPVVAPGILDSRTRQQPARRRSAPVRRPSAPSPGARPPGGRLRQQEGPTWVARPAARERLQRQLHHRPRGAGSGPQAPRHVHRLHR